MYSYIKGKITEIGESYIVVEAGGIGYELSVSTNAMSEFASRDGEVKVYCYLSVREDGVSLFGFESKMEKSMFLKLVAVSGVGPKLALTVLGGMTTEQFAAAVIGSDIKALSKIKGVGKKTAERIALEPEAAVLRVQKDGMTLEQLVYAALKNA